MRAVLVAAVMALSVPLAAGRAAVAAQQPATFRAGIDLIEVTAIVTDQRDQVVTGLTAADFEVIDDRRAQPIAAFSEVARPFTPLGEGAFAALPIDTDVGSNIGSDGRVYAIVLDAAHIDSERTERVRTAARLFIERSLAANDIAAVIVTGDRQATALTQQFTANRLRLIESVNRFAGARLRSANALTLPSASARDGGADPLALDAPGPVQNPADLERGNRAKATLDTVKNLADALAGVHGRRAALIFISEGIGYGGNDWVDSRAARTAADGVKASVEAATRANVSIYAIDPRGLGNITASALQDELAVSQQTLRTLAEDTGGFAALNAQDVATSFERIVRDNSAYYVLGYAPAADRRRDTRYRRLEVRVKRPGLRVRARRGYMAPRDDIQVKSTANLLALREAMNSPLPVTGLPMSVFAVPFKSAGSNSTVIVCYEWPGGDANFAARDGAMNTLEIEVAALDARGMVRGGAHHSVSLTFEPQSIASVRRTGLRLMSQLDLPPGRYQLRIAAAESQGATAGSVLYDLDVPDFTRAPLAMSGISVYSWPEAPAQLTTGADVPMSGVLPFPPALRREFGRDDEVALFAEVYENRPALPAHAMAFRATLVTPDGRAVAQSGERWSSADLRGHRGEYGVQAKVPLKDAAPGVYFVRVEARSDAAAEPVVRVFPIRVR